MVINSKRFDLLAINTVNGGLADISKLTRYYSFKASVT